MSNPKHIYAWNRNASTHAMALTRFAVFSFIFSSFNFLIVVLSMGVYSDGTRQWVEWTVIGGTLATVVSFVVFFTMFVVMYQWVNEAASGERVSTKEKSVYWVQDGNHWSRENKKPDKVTR